MNTVNNINPINRLCQTLASLPPSERVRRLATLYYGSAKALAEHLGVTDVHLNRVANGCRESAILKARIAEALEMDPVELWDEGNQAA